MDTEFEPMLSGFYVKNRDIIEVIGISVLKVLLQTFSSMGLIRFSPWTLSYVLSVDIMM